MTKTSKTPSFSKTVKAKSSAAKASSSKKDANSKPADKIILEAMAKLHKRGNETVEKKKLASVTKLNPKTMANAITKLKKKNLLEADNANFTLTKEGLNETRGMDIKGGSTNKEVHEQIKKKLKGKAVRLFELIEDGEEHDKEEVAQDLGFIEKGKKQKGFMNLVASMKREGIVHYPTKDTVQLVKEECFPYDE